MDEMFGLVATLTLNGQRQRSLSDSGATGKDTCTSGKCKYEFTTELSSQVPVWQLGECNMLVVVLQLK